MTKIDDLIKQSLTAINEGYLKAVRDLERILDELTSSIRKHSGLAKCRLSMVREDETVVRTIYSVNLDLSFYSKETVDVDCFRINAKGYPIDYGVYVERNLVFREQGSINNAEELEAHFAAMLSDPNSALIQGIGFGMRKAKELEEMDKFLRDNDNVI